MFNSQHQLLDMSSSAQRTPENELDFLRDESGTENMEAPNSGDDQADPNQPRNKKKRYHRHTQHQIQEMEAFYKECNHPDDKQRKELGIRLGLEPLQVKFWFQNKRTQMKAQHERSENAQLRNENEKLRAENSRYKEALNNAICPNCGGPASVGEMSFDEQHLRIENARLRDEIDRITGVAGGYVGKSSLNFPPHQLPPPEAPHCMDVAFGPQSSLRGEMFPSGDLLRITAAGLTDAEKPMVIELAVTAMEELVRMAQTEEPLWMPTSGIISTETLCEQEYARMFPRGIGPKSSTLSSEATRETAVVIMNHINLVEILMDVNKWTCVFAGIVSKAMTLEVLSTGVAGNHNGALQVMTAEFQVPSPLVPTRENYFVRYCKQHAEGTWAVVDISLENLRSTAVSHYRRRPSGCLIEELQNGYSRVTWVEHVEVDERAVHDIYKPLVNSGIAFGAKRWVATLDRQCERLASAMANNVSTGDTDLLSNPAGRKSMLKLAERMVTSFCAGVGASTAHVWTVLSGSGSEDVRVMTRKSVDDPGRPAGIVLSAATSFWLPVSPRRVFDFLRAENSRSQWDILSNGGIVQEMSHIANGRDPGNCVSLLRVNSGTNFNQSNMLILQESVTDPTGSYVIYAPVDITAMNLVLGGGDPDYAALLPSGFAILPDGPMNHDGGNSEIGPVGGSLLTVAFQILVDSVPTAKLSLGSIATVNSLIKCTIKKIKEAVTSENAP